MKKWLILVMTVISVMACEEGEKISPEKDKDALKAVTVNAISLLGQNQTVVEKTLSDAAFIRVWDTVYYNIILLARNPVRISANEQRLNNDKKTDGIIEELYYYGLPDKFFQQNDQEIVNYLDKFFADGRSLCITQVLYKDGKLFKIRTDYNTLLTEKPFLTYNEISDGLFFPSKESNRFWRGTIRRFHSEDSQYYVDEYKDHAQYLDVLASDSAITNAVEYCYTETNPANSERFYYNTYWLNPTDDMKTEMRAMGFFHYYMYHSFTIGYNSSF